MKRTEAIAAIEAGITVANAEIKAGCRLLITGDMGIGNTTASAAVTAALTGLSTEEVTGPGTGLGLMGWRRKCEVVQQAVALHAPDPEDPIDILAKVGGLEIGAITGMILAAAAAKIPILLDGIASTAGAAIAVGLSPDAKNVMIAGHRSTEPGHRVLLNYLDLTPVLDLDLRLGEGAGGVMAVPILEAAVATLNEMATFEEAQVYNRNQGSSDQMIID